MLIETTAQTAPAAPHKVGNFSKGQTRGDVSKQWMSRPHDERFLSLSALRDSVQARRDRSAEDTISTHKIEFIAPEVKTRDDLHRLTVGLPGGHEIAPTHWSFGQLAALAGAPSGYLRTLPSQIAADNLTWGLRHVRAQETIKSYRAGGELLAATGPNYGRIFDADVVDAVMNVAGDGVGDARWKIPGTLDWRNMTYDPETPVSLDTTTLYASDRDVFIFLVDDRNPIEIGKLPSGDPDLVFRGFYISNSEMGSASLKVASFYLRAVCCNRLLWGVEGFTEITMRHGKNAPSRFIEQCRPALNSFADGSAKTLIEGVEKAKAAKIAADDDAALDFLLARKMPRASALKVLEAVEKEEGRPARTIWDMAQGISAVARDIPHTNDRVAFEDEARKLLDKVS